MSNRRRPYTGVLIVSETCKYCGSIRTEEGTLFWNAFHCGTGFYGDEPDKQRQSPECKDRQLTALAQRDEQAETRIKEYRERIEELETDKAMYRDKWLNALERVIAAESEVKRLREALTNISAPLNYLQELTRLKGDEYRMEWPIAIKLSESVGFLKQIARDALLAPPNNK